MDKEAEGASSSLDRAGAMRLMTEARRLYELAELVQARRIVGGIDSAVLAQRSLSIVLRLLIRLRGDPVPDGFGELVERARLIVGAESLMAEDFSADLLVVNEMRDRFVRLGGETTPSDDRRYDRAFVRAGEWQPAVQKYLDQRLPPPDSRTRRHFGLAFGAAVVFLIGFAAGKHVRPEPAAASHVALRAPGVSSAPPSFLGRFYKDTIFGEQILTRRDPSIAFDWDADSPADSVPRDHFSVRWDGTLYVEESGKYTFYLASDDGSRLLLDGVLAIDNWGGHSAVTKTSVIDVAQGVHAIGVEYFDEVGPALVKLEWSGERFERRVITSTDLR